MKNDVDYSAESDDIVDDDDNAIRNGPTTSKVGGEPFNDSLSETVTIGEAFRRQQFPKLLDSFIILILASFAGRVFDVFRHRQGIFSARANKGRPAPGYRD